MRAKVPTEKEDGCRAGHDVMESSLNRCNAWRSRRRDHSPAGEGSGEARTRSFPGGVVLEKIDQSSEQRLPSSNLVFSTAISFICGQLQMVRSKWPSVLKMTG